MSTELLTFDKLKLLKKDTRFKLIPYEEKTNSYPNENILSSIFVISSKPKKLDKTNDTLTFEFYDSTKHKTPKACIVLHFSCFMEEDDIVSGMIIFKAPNEICDTISPYIPQGKYKEFALQIIN